MFDNYPYFNLLKCSNGIGSRCLPALVAYKHVVTVFVRNIHKLRLMMTPTLLEQVHAIYLAALKKALLYHDIDGAIDVAGNLTPP